MVGAQMWRETVQQLRERYEAVRQFAMSTGAERPVPEDVWGAEVKLYRRYRDGHETVEELPCWIAQLTLAAIPYNEPEVERASFKQLKVRDPIMKGGGKKHA